MRTDKVFIKFRNEACKTKFKEEYKEGILATVCGNLCGKSKLSMNNCQLYIERLGDPR